MVNKALGGGVAKGRGVAYDCLPLDFRMADRCGVGMVGLSSGYNPASLVELTKAGHERVHLT